MRLNTLAGKDRELALEVLSCHSTGRAGHRSSWWSDFLGAKGQKEQEEVFGHVGGGL